MESSRAETVGFPETMVPAAGSYQVVVEEMGYQTATQRLDVNGPVSGIYIELRSVHTAGTMVSGNPTVSARELSIPRKAHDDMQKGLAKLNGKPDYQGSIKDFERAIQEYPDYHEAYAQMGVAYLHLGNNTNSEQALRKSLELSKNQDVDALIWLATLLSNGDKYAEAEPLARKAVDLNPNSWQANSELARALLGLNRFEEAEKNAQAAVKLRPDNPLLYLIEANIHEQLQEPGVTRRSEQLSETRAERAIRRPSPKAKRTSRAGAWKHAGRPGPFSRQVSGL